METRAIGHKSSKSDELTKAKYRRKSVLQRQLGELFLVRSRKHVGENDCCLRMVLDHESERFLDLGQRANLIRAQRQI